MNIDMQEARRLIMLIVKNNHPAGVIYPTLDRLFVLKMPDMIIGGYGNKLMPLIDEMIDEGIIQQSGHGYIKGSNFPENF